MNTKRKLNCYVFSNLIISFLSLNLLTYNQTTSLNLVNEKGIGSLNEIYELKTITTNNINSTNNTTTILVSNKVVQSKNTKTINYIKPSYNSTTGANLVNYAKHYLGLRYVSGGYSLTTGTDCSGFTKLIFNEFGIGLGRTVNSQIYSGKYVSKSDLEPGDLVFYGNYSNYASHVAIYIGNGLVIHESNPSDGVKISSLNMMVYITARRVIFENVSSNMNQEIETEEIVEDKQEEIKETTNNVLEENNEDNIILDESNNSSTLENESTDNSNIVLEDTKEEIVEIDSNNTDNDVILEDTNEITNDNQDNEVQTETSSNTETNEITIEESNNLSMNNIENTDTSLE